MKPRVLREANRGRLMRPRLLWYADGDLVSFGVELNDDGFGDPFLALSVEISLTPDESEWVFNAIERTVCRVLGHADQNLGISTNPEWLADWDGRLWKRCDRCLRYEQRGYVPVGGDERA